MRILNSSQSLDGAYGSPQDWSGATPPDGYYQIANGVDEAPLTNNGGFVTLTIADGIITGFTPDTDTWEAWKADNGPDLKSIKAERIAESKTALAEYLASNPLTWTDGKRYSATEDKQALLTGNIAAYQLAVTLGQSPELTWNATGEECTGWTFENLAALAVAIKAYVKPLVAYQQAAEVAINACTTAEKVEAVAINYENA